MVPAGAPVHLSLGCSRTRCPRERSKAPRDVPQKRGAEASSRAQKVPVAGEQQRGPQLPWAARAPHPGPGRALAGGTRAPERSQPRSRTHTWRSPASLGGGSPAPRRAPAVTAATGGGAWRCLAAPASRTSAAPPRHHRAPPPAARPPPHEGPLQTAAPQAPHLQQPGTPGGEGSTGRAGPAAHARCSRPHSAPPRRGSAARKRPQPFPSVRSARASVLYASVLFDHDPGFL